MIEESVEARGKWALIYSLNEYHGSKIDVLEFTFKTCMALRGNKKRGEMVAAPTLDHLSVCNHPSNCSHCRRKTVQPKWDNLKG